MLRLYLAALVVLDHLGVFGLGVLSVYLFFILSGFWITSVWHRVYLQCRAPYLTFLISRFWRLFPLYFICIGLMMGVSALFSAEFAAEWPLFVKNDLSWLWVLRTLLIVSSTTQPHSLPTTWSLDVEMQFYLIAPVLLSILGLACRKNKAGALVMVMLSCIISLGIISQPPLRIHLGAFICFFLIGSLIQHLRWRPRGTLALGGALSFIALRLILGPIPEDPALASVARFLMALCLVACVAYSLYAPSDSTDRILGDLAYPVYLFHWIPLVGVGCSYRLHALGAKVVSLCELLAIIAGSLALYYFIDRPVDRMRRAFVNGRKRVLAVEDPSPRAKQCAK